MDKAIEMYKEIIDELATMSKDCADARGVKKVSCREPMQSKWV